MKKILIILCLLLVGCGKEEKIAPTNLVVSSNREESKVVLNGEITFDAVVIKEEEINLEIKVEGPKGFNNKIGIEAFYLNGKEIEDMLDNKTFIPKDAGDYYLNIYSKVDKNINYTFKIRCLEASYLEGKEEISVLEEASLMVKNNRKEKITKTECKSQNEKIATFENGYVKGKSIGKTVLELTTTYEDNKVYTSLYPISVIEVIESSNLAGGEAGEKYNLKYANQDVRAYILSQMEKYLIDEGASIPLFNNSGAVLYSSRIKLPTNDYISQMGRGAIYGAIGTGRASNIYSDPAYRIADTASPTTLNHFNYKDSVESDILSLVLGSLYKFEFIDKNNDLIFDGYEMIPSMAKIEPIAVNNNNVALNDQDSLSKKWLITLQEDLYFVDYDGNKKRQIKAEDFIYSYKQLLDPLQKNSRASTLYGSSFSIKGAKEYFQQTASKRNDYAIGFNTVGIKKVDEYSFTIETVNDLKKWDVMYNLSSFVTTPVYKEIYEELMNDEGTQSSYGKIPSDASKINSLMFSGMYYISYLEDEKQTRLTQNISYSYNKQEKKPTPRMIITTVVKDANAALELFKAGNLDVVSIPASEYDNYKTNPGLLKNPGVTTFRLSINQLTQAESDKKWGKVWNTKEILQQKKFREALYYAIDRQTLATEVLKTSSPDQFYYTSAYIIDQYTGFNYRDSEVVKNTFKNYDIDSYGYNRQYAIDCYVEALKKMIDEGIIKNGSKGNKTKITFEIASFDGATHEAMLDYLEDSLEKLFNSQEVYNVTLDITTDACPNMDIYYEKQMKGRFDLAMAGLSGGTLDPASFMECFCDDNRSGLLLNQGIDTHNPKIKINLDLNNNGILDGEKYWSFDALYRILNGEVVVKMGREDE